MRTKTAIAWLALATALTGCAAMEGATRRNEARQLAWIGPGMGPCAFGGVTPRAAEHCALLDSGPEGVLMVVNEKVRARLGPGADPLAHVDEARRLLRRYDDLRTEPLYTCGPGAVSREACGVSLLVTAEDGERYVLDSGAVIGEMVSPEGVVPMMVFETFVHGQYAIDALPPRAVAGGGLETGAAAK